MISFHPIELEDRNWIVRLIREEDSRSADYNFTNIFVWDETYLQRVAEVEGCLAIRLDYENAPFFTYPVGGGDTRAAVLALQREAADCGFPFCLRGVTAEHAEKLTALFPGQFELIPDRFAFDYIYPAEKLATLSGKKLHGKRNHINRFVEDHPDWYYETLTQAGLEVCSAFQREWLSASGEGDSEEYSHEDLALRRAMENYSALGLEGGILRVGGTVAGFTIGEKLNSDTYVVHFEKGKSEIQGAYAMLNREFVRQALAQHPEVQYINRGDDVGHENLRLAKQSYHPEFLIEKYTALWK